DVVDRPWRTVGESRVLRVQTQPPPEGAAAVVPGVGVTRGIAVDAALGRLREAVLLQGRVGELHLPLELAPVSTWRPRERDLALRQHLAGGVAVHEVRWITDLAAVDPAVAAELDLAAGRASVAGLGVAVVALLGRVARPVAAR